MFVRITISLQQQQYWVEVDLLRGFEQYKFLSAPHPVFRALAVNERLYAMLLSAMAA